MKKTEGMTGFRKPTEEEKKKINCYFKAYYKKRIRTYKRISNLLCVVGASFFLSFSKLGIPGLVVGSLFFALAIKGIWVKNRCRRDEKTYENGNFQVLEGYISKIETDSTTVNQDSVMFESKYGQNLEQWLPVRTKDLHVGAELLLVRMEDLEIKKENLFVFTKDMLTEDGYQHTI